LLSGDISASTTAGGPTRRLTGKPPIRPDSTRRRPKRPRRERGGNPPKKHPEVVQPNRATSMIPSRRLRRNSLPGSGPNPPQSAPHLGELGQKGAVPRRIGRTKGGLTSKLRTVCDGDDKPLILLLTEGHPLVDCCAIACRAAGQRLPRRRDRLARAAERRNPDRRQGRRGATGSVKPCLI
ncbi:MAG: hypothetical protein ACI87T_003565, partial [Planctomycetota bacterium]